MPAQRAYQHQVSSCEKLKLGAISDPTGDITFANLDSGQPEIFRLNGKDVDGEAINAQRCITNPLTHEPQVEYGRIIGRIMESRYFKWEVDGAIAVTAIGVAVHTLHKYRTEHRR
jgi:hypothetical protein